ncbi:putative T7SS-secreted protein [Kitasatospora sp. NPDC054939]
MSGGLLDRALSAGGKFIDVNVQAGAEILKGGSRAAGGLLEEVGLDGAAQSVRGWGDDVADAGGLRVGEARLGQSDDVRHLLHGDPKRIAEVAAHLKKFHDAFEKTGTALSRLDHEHWKGQAAEAFRATFTPQPKAWLSAADACGKAAAALDNYAHTVTWSRGQAEEAVKMWKAAQQKLDAATAQWRQDALTYNLRAKAYNAMPADQRPSTPPARPEDFTNPVEAEFQAAQDKLDAARRQRDSAATTAAAAVGAAMEAAPNKPSPTQQLKADLSDGLSAAPVALLHFEGGLLQSGTDLLKLGRSLNPYDPYNISHPHKYVETVNTTLAGLITAGDHPVELVKGIVGSGWGSDPSEASGKLVGNILLGAGTGGSGTTAKTAATAAAQNAAKTAAKNTAENVAKEAADQAAKEAFEKLAKDAAARPPVPSPTNPAGLPEGWTVPGKETADNAAQQAFEQQAAELAAKDAAVASKLQDLMELESRATGAWPDDPLKAAADRNVNLSGLPYEPKWRTSTEDLYRFDNRPPDRIFTEDGGLKPLSSDFNDLAAYAGSGSKDSVYVGTTRDPNLKLGANRLWRYEVDAPGGIDVNASLGRKEAGGISPHADEAEIAFPGGVDVRHIKGAWRLENGKPVEFVPNPHYRPG